MSEDRVRREKENDGIRKLEPEEFQKAMDLVYESFLQYDAVDYPEEGKKNFQIDVYENPLFYQMLQQEGNGLYGYFQEGELTGVLGVRRKNHILLLYARSDKLKQGIGSSLIRFFIGVCNEPVITVNSAPYAYGFYEKMGFHAVEEPVNKHGIISKAMEYRK